MDLGFGVEVQRVFLAYCLGFGIEGLGIGFTNGALGCKAEAIHLSNSVCAKLGVYAYARLKNEVVCIYRPITIPVTHVGSL